MTTNPSHSQYNCRIPYHHKPCSNYLGSYLVDFEDFFQGARSDTLVDDNHATAKIRLLLIQSPLSLAPSSGRTEAPASMSMKRPSALNRFRF